MELLISSILLVPVALAVAFFLLRAKFYKNKGNATKGKQVVAFFHPYCNDGGGGERVLWCAVKALQEMKRNVHIVIYTGLESTSNSNLKEEGNQILQKAAARFDIKVSSADLEFVFLTKRWLVEAKTWPRFTLIGQSIGSMILGWEALCKSTPDIFIDTMGYAFTFPLFKVVGGCRVACYVHYPTISTDMLNVVQQGKTQYNNASNISGSSLKTKAKLYYYKLFARLYGFVGSFSELVMTNSSWTLGHINSLWDAPSRTFRVYPPCNTTRLQQIPLSTEQREKIIISIGQFRPEKDHKLQIESFRQLLDTYPQHKGKVRLVLIGSSRNEEDNARVAALKKRAAELQFAENEVEFVINAPFEQLTSWYARAMVGVHTMWNEHFGIGVVELMAAGVIPVAHNSGGPKQDIVVDYDGRPTGHLATTAEEYANKFNVILSMNKEERGEMQKNGRLSAQRFSDEVFETSFQTLISRVLD